MGTKKTLLFVFGTRPEVIKLAPVIRAFEEDGTLEVRVCVTAQHREMLDQFVEFFGLHPDADLDLMTHGQSLADMASRVIEKSAGVYAEFKPDMVFVQGDTMSAFSAAFAARIGKIPVAHVEAGLRSHCKDSPFPEEISRVLISHLADLHFAHTGSAAENLEKEGIRENVFVVGNTIVDALLLTLRMIGTTGAERYAKAFPGIDFGRRIVLVTLHRRESWGAPLEEACEAIKELALLHPDTEFIYPVHRNPRVRESVFGILAGLDNVRLLEPLDYAEFAWALSKACLVITDSGGVVEEAATLGIPTLVAREVTERAEAVEAGHAKLVGCDAGRIVTAANEALAEVEGSGARGSAEPRLAGNVFGDGKASERIVEITKRHLLAGVEKVEKIETALAAGG